VIPAVLPAVIGVAMTETTEESMGWVGRSRSFVEEVQAEFQKITWTPQDEMVNGTIAVVVIVAIMATFLGIVDFGLSQVMQMVLG
jgi:preprotein translocase subunit SecE